MLFLFLLINFIEINCGKTKKSYYDEKFMNGFSTDHVIHFCLNQCCDAYKRKNEPFLPIKPVRKVIATKNKTNSEPDWI